MPASVPTLIPPTHPRSPSPLRAQTNNPRKISELQKMGVSVTGRIACLVQAGEFNQVSHMRAWGGARASGGGEGRGRRRGQAG